LDNAGSLVTQAKGRTHEVVRVTGLEEVEALLNRPDAPEDDLAQSNPFDVEPLAAEQHRLASDFDNSIRALRIESS
jgi:hypothetical protein